MVRHPVWSAVAVPGEHMFPAGPLSYLPAMLDSQILSRFSNYTDNYI